MLCGFWDNPGLSTIRNVSSPSRCSHRIIFCMLTFSLLLDLQNSVRTDPVEKSRLLFSYTKDTIYAYIVFLISTPNCHEDDDFMRFVFIIGFPRFRLKLRLGVDVLHILLKNFAQHFRVSFSSRLCKARNGFEIYAKDVPTKHHIRVARNL
jgi:hypothetical protein